MQGLRYIRYCDVETENTNQHTEDCDEAYIGPLPNRVTIVWSSAVKFSVVQLLLRILFACMDTWDFTMFIFDNPYMVLITTRCVQSFIIWSLKVYDSGSIEFLGTHRSVYCITTKMSAIKIKKTVWRHLRISIMHFHLSICITSFEVIYAGRIKKRTPINFNQQCAFHIHH